MDTWRYHYPLCSTGKGGWGESERLAISNLINNLKKCREIALKKMLAKEGCETATMAKPPVDDEEKVDTRIFVNGNNVVRIAWGDLRVVAAILAKQGLSLKEMNGNRMSLSRRGSDVEWPLTKIFIFLKSNLGTYRPRDETTAEKLELDKGLETQIAKFLEGSSFDILGESAAGKIPSIDPHESGAHGATKIDVKKS